MCLVRKWRLTIQTTLCCLYTLATDEMSESIPESLDSDKLILGIEEAMVYIENADDDSEHLKHIVTD